MSSFRYERTDDGLGTILAESAGIGAREDDTAGLQAAIERMLAEAGSLRGVVLAPIDETIAEPAFERLLETAPHVSAVLAREATAGSFALALRCAHLVCVEAARLRLQQPGATALPYLGDEAGISPDEARAAGLVDEVVCDLSGATAAAQRWARSAAAARNRSVPAPAGIDAVAALGTRSSRISAGVHAVATEMNASFAGRVFGSFLIEGLTLLGEGVAADSVEQAALDAGMAAGPLAALDESGLGPIDHALHMALDGHGHGHGHDDQPGHAHGAHAHAHDAHAHDAHAHDAHDHGAHAHGAHDHSHGHHQCCAHEDHHPPALAPLALPKAAVYVVEKMAHGLKRTGRASGGGFYAHEDDDAPGLWSGLSSFRRRSAAVPAEDIRDRLIFAMAIEAQRCLGATDVDSVRVGDIVSLYGCGFPLATGGVMSFAAGAAATTFATRAGELAAKYGERFLWPGAGDNPPDSHAHEHAH
ncbi:MAG: hypothetical protein ACLGII_12690 [Gammaproteobacteria bacterium]